MPLQSLNDYINRANNSYIIQRHYGAQNDVSVSTTQLIPQATSTMQLSPVIYTTETLPSGVTGYRLTNASCFTADSANSTRTNLLVKLVNFGSFVLTGETYTAGVGMPTVTEGGVSRQISGPILLAVSSGQTVSSVGVLSITYTNQDGASQTATASISNAIAVGSCSFVQLVGVDTGARQVTNMARASGTMASATLQAWGVIPMGIMNATTITTTNQPGVVNFMTDYFPPPLLAAGESLYLLSLGTTTKGHKGKLTFIGESA